MEGTLEQHLEDTMKSPAVVGVLCTDSQGLNLGWPPQPHGTHPPPYTERSQSQLVLPLGFRLPVARGHQRGEMLHGLSREAGAAPTAPEGICLCGGTWNGLGWKGSVKVT
ncbi:ragulator complex protein LAMTOR5 isoform X1 [Lathamus discolor]|uniref:ragulator complex protein LAMTOR5 isoform X1 n=1 Tax=Lathamus discolor TaxID=678569 RepID=UPI0032B747D1